jgi:hypothetical protein
MTDAEANGTTSAPPRSLSPTAAPLEFGFIPRIAGQPLARKGSRFSALIWSLSAAIGRTRRSIYLLGGRTR